MKTNPFWATDDFAREVAKRKIWSRRAWSNRKIHAFLRLAQPSDVIPGIFNYEDFRREVAQGQYLVSACYPKIRNRLSDWNHQRYFLGTNVANGESSTFRLDTVRAEHPWHIEQMCLTCRRVIAMGERVGFGVCSDYD